ncbi:MAG TPA: hypothetical protein VIR81_04810 [Myxococcales bacterium]|nr:hypothetical protein [Myxococcales bacterium]
MIPPARLGMRGLAAVLLFAAPAGASIVSRLENETARSFAARNGPPRAALAHQVIETRAFAGRSKAIIAFYEQAGDRIEGWIYLPEGQGRYRKVAIDTFQPEGAEPEIESAFFADAGGRRKLVVLCSWPQIHQDVRGRLYGVFVYQAPRPGSTAAKLKFEAAISKKLESGCDCEWRDGKKTTARYKTAAQVRAALRKMAP